MFSEHAPKYWAVGLPAIPLRYHQKAPIINSWSTYSQLMPTEVEQARWLAGYPDGNIGLPLGPQSGVVAIDLDSEDPRVAEILERMLPPSPWRRVGKKGYVAAFKYNGEKSTRIKDSSGNMLLEILSINTQIVLPPSIHPDTQLPYQANSNLYEVMDKLVPLPMHFETNIRKALIAAGFELTTKGAAKVTDWVPAGGRDSAMVGMAGIHARSVVRAERTLLEALAEIDAWIGSFTEHVSGDPLDPIKGRNKVLEFIRRDITEAGHTLPKGWDAGLNSEELAEVRRYFGEDIEEWTPDQMMDYLKTGFETCPADDVAGRTRIIDEILIKMVKLAKINRLTSLDVDLLTQYIIHSGGSKTLSAAGIRKRMKELEGKEVIGANHSEIAKLLIAEMSRYGEIKYTNSKFYQYRGSHWQRLEDTEVKNVMINNYGSLDMGRRESDHRGIIKIVTSLVAGELEEVNIPGVNFANGYLTRDMELLDHDPKYGAQYVLPYRYVPNAAAPIRFLSFLDQCWGGDTDYAEKVQALKQVLCSILFKQAAERQRAFCFYGVPGSGKSALKDIIVSLLPENMTCSVEPHDFGHPFKPTQMSGQLLNVAGELSDTEMISGDRFKLIIEGAEMLGQLKGQDYFKFRPLCAQLFCSNHLPRTRDTSDGFNRRWLILEFRKAISENEKILNVGQLIATEEREEIVCWALEAQKDLNRLTDYTLPKSHHDLIGEIKTLNNNVYLFMTSSGMCRVTKDPADVITGDQLYEYYKIFCRVSANTSTFSKVRFNVNMSQLALTMDFKQHSSIKDGQREVLYEGIVGPKTTNKLRVA